MRRYHLNLPIVVFFGLLLLIALLAMNNQNNLLFWVFGAMVALLLVSGAVSGLMMRGLTVHRLDPRHGSVGEPMVVRYQIGNRNHLLAAFSLRVEDLDTAPVSIWRRLFELVTLLPSRGFDMGDALRAGVARRRAAGRTSFWRHMRPEPAWIMHVAPRDSAHADAVLWPVRRGTARFEHIRVSTSFPFGLVRKSMTIRQPVRTLIYPRLYELRRGVLAALTPKGPPGDVVSARAGFGDDYFGLREYRPGDSLKHIAWKRTARRDELICIEHAHSSPPRLRILLNLTVTAGREPPDPALQEQAISLTASLVHAADLGGYEVGLSVLGADTPPLPIRRSQWHRARIMAALAAIDLDVERHAYDPEQIGDVALVGVVVVHPDRVEPGIGRADAWHLSARQLDQLVEGPIGWDPQLNTHLIAREPGHSDAARESAA